MSKRIQNEFHNDIKCEQNNARAKRMIIDHCKKPPSLLFASHWKRNCKHFRAFLGKLCARVHISQELPTIASSNSQGHGLTFCRHSGDRCFCSESESTICQTPAVNFLEEIFSPSWFSTTEKKFFCTEESVRITA
jgi:hypothetical protein